jgi:hypothetical protein
MPGSTNSNERVMLQPRPGEKKSLLAFVIKSDKKYFHHEKPEEWNRASQ